MTNGLFAPRQGITREDKDSGKIRQFTGSGTGELSVPGLKSLTAVRVGTMDLPLTRTVKFTDSANAEERVNATWPLVVTDEDEDGNPVLLRSTLSNDGVWQAGVTIYVTGEWEPEATEGAEDAAAPGTAKPRNTRKKQGEATSDSENQPAE